jgi:hypothetical protein
MQPVGTGWGSLDIFSKLIEDANQNLFDTIDFAMLPTIMPIMQPLNNIAK